MKKMTALMVLSGAIAAVGIPIGPSLMAQPKSGEDAVARARRSQPLYVGDMAPAFTLESLDGESTTDTTQFRGQRPLILFFGSYT